MSGLESTATESGRRSQASSVSMAPSDHRPLDAALRWLVVGAVGTMVLALGFWLAIARRPQFYPGLIMVLGAVLLILFLLVNEAYWSPPEK